MVVNIPKEVKFVIERLNTLGYCAYPVGGCVRDTLLVRTPHDWDVTTNARPEVIVPAFYDCKCIKKGAHFGTIGIIVSDMQIEVTTFRIEAGYTDMRRPDKVIFSSRLHDDLARRDFTINAMACTPDGDIVDCFSGLDDIKSRIIRAVGDPYERFAEDALRIMRALRFASELGFTIECSTRRAMVENRMRLKHIASERILEEFKRLIIGDNVAHVLQVYAKVFAVFMPDVLDPADGNPGIPFCMIAHLKKDVAVRIAALYLCSKITDPVRSACEMLSSMKADRALISDVSSIITAYEMSKDLSDSALMRLLSKYKERISQGMLDIKRCMAVQKGDCGEAIKYGAAIARLNTIINESPCISVKDLKIDGETLKELGIEPSPRMGRILYALLEAVISGEIENDRSQLEQYVKKLKSKT